MTNRVIEVIRRAGGAASAAASAVRAEAAALNADTDALAAAASASAAAASALSVNAANLLTKVGNLAGLSSPAAARTNLGVKANVLASGAMTGTIMEFYVPSDVKSLKFEFWNHASTVAGGADLYLQIGNGTPASPNWLTAANYSWQYIWSAGGAPAYASTSGATAFRLSSGQGSNGQGAGVFDILNFHPATAGINHLIGNRSNRGAIIGTDEVATEFSKTSFALVATSIRWLTSVGTLSGQYMITGYSA